MILLYDRMLFGLLLGLICIGFIITSSGSIPVGINIAGDPYFFIKRAIIYYIITFLISLIVLNIPIVVWKNCSFIMLLCSFCMLVVVLIFNNTINGASRWVIWGSLCAQPSELSKLFFIFYFANYLERKLIEVRSTFWGVCKPIIIVFLLSLLLLRQPDFGSIIILFIITLYILFLFGAKLNQLALIFILSIFFIILSVALKPYRIQRMLSFWDPWKDPFGNGYQLTQSLMAFGRGGYFGRGLGNSIQKLEYLPESHTDFVFSILAEELGLVGSILVLMILFGVVFRAMIIGTHALYYNQKFSSVLAYSIGIWLGIQTFINVGVVSGILPIKGLTLPFISYGGSSFLITTIIGMLLIRIDFEIRLIKHQAFFEK
ncbi:cell division protein [Candidatus Blochmanniella vafra str. BVAF]|uniref:Probable peptidoglycan glycosyltransferase FtsW n=1 Tax=Blochmanniella vafra (strain BVAF) TaxID=859654 RepID=E8Q5Q2_BLOVB|nr:putative lipid II flippase FtsW [Candidatus Blochmannia vafer]ADV33549.1 cell division protein [Candidatus Blochmannia vafer str. BVAF]